MKRPCYLPYLPQINWKSKTKSDTIESKTVIKIKVVESVTENDRNYKVFNFFDKSDERILKSVADGKFNIDGLTNKELRKLLPDKSSGQLSRILKRLRVHGLIKKSAKLINII